MASAHGVFVGQLVLGSILVVVGHQVGALRWGERAAVGARGELQQCVQMPGFRFGALLFEVAQGGVDPVEMIADGLGGYGVVGWIGRGLGAGSCRAS